MTDLEMARELEDMGYDVDLDVSTGTYDKGLVAEMAVNEGYVWDDRAGKWGRN